LKSLSFQQINEDDLTFFAKTLAFLDLSDNMFGIKSDSGFDPNEELSKLKTLNAIQELNLASNNITSLQFISNKTSRWSEN
jgi:hypothetical protein